MKKVLFIILAISVAIPIVIGPLSPPPIPLTIRL